MQVIRNLTEAPSASDVVGTTRFVGSLMRPVVFKHGVAMQDAVQGNVTAAAGAYQVLPSDGIVLATTAGSQTVTLPAVANVPKGHVVRVKKAGNGGTLTLEGSGSETVDNAANLTTTTLYDTISVISDGAEWWSVGYAAAVTGTNRVLVTTAQTTTATIAITDDVTIDSGTASHTLTLPTAVGNDGAVLTVKKTGATGVITVDGDGTETIDGALNLTLTYQYESATLLSDGTNWMRIDVDNHVQIVSKSTTYTVLPTDAMVLATGNSAFTITLPVAAASTGQQVTFKKTGTTAGPITIDGDSAETIDGAASVILYHQYETITLVSDGTSWHTVSRTKPLATQTVAGAGTIVSGVDVVLQTSDTAVSVALPDPALQAGKYLWFKKAVNGGTQATTLTTPGAETIDGAASLAVTAAYRSVLLYSDGTNWHMLSNTTPAAG